MDRKQLENLIHSSEEKISHLKTIDYDKLQENITELESIFKEFKESGENLLSEGNILQIGIVGQVKAGKSSFLNSLFFDGENVLPKASTPMTAGLTIIEYAEENTFEVEYFNNDDWEIFEKQNEEYKKREQEIRSQNQGAPENIIRRELENRTSDKIRSAHDMVSSCTPEARQKIGSKNDCKDFVNIKELQNVLEQYVGANGEYTSVVKSLYIKINDTRLKGLRIVDTPGVNDPVVSRENRTRTFLQSCHGVFLLSASTDFLSSGDINFLNTRIGGSGIGSIVLLASKFDSVLQDIGAEREMKKEEKGDLGETADMQIRKFRKRLNELSDTINEKLRGHIKLDATAGIGFSIAHKSPDQWDNIEKQVVQQMKRYYPEYFSTESDIKESFNMLANMEEIKEKFLDNVFMKNKDTIISEKVKNFFESNKQEISDTIDKILEEYKNRYQQLNETTQKEIENQKVIQEKLFDNLKDKFKNKFGAFAGNIQSEIRHISNNIQFNEIKDIPTEQTQQPITCKGMFWGYNTNEIKFDCVNSYELNKIIDNAIDDYVKSWNSEWKEMFEKAKEKMLADLNDTIYEAELNIKSTTFNDTYYRNLIESALNDLNQNKELEIGDIITEYKHLGYDIARKQYIPYDTKEYKEEQLQSLLKKQLNEHKEVLIHELRNLVVSIKEDTKKQVQKNSNNTTNTIDRLKNDFSKKLTEEGQKYLTQLEKDMSKKTTVLKNIEAAMKYIEELSLMYK